MTPYAKVMVGGAMLGGDAPSHHTFGLRWKPHSRFDVDAHADSAAAYRIGLHCFNKRLLDFTLSGERKAGAKHALALKGTLIF